MYKGFKPFLLQCWGLSSVADYLASDAPRAAGAAMGPFQAQAFALREQCSGIINSLSQPVPFPYFHILSLMLSVNLGLLAYALVSWETVLTIPAFFITCLVMLGLKETSIAISDPFGGDAVDFETDQYMAALLANTKALLTQRSEDAMRAMPLPCHSGGLPTSSS